MSPRVLLQVHIHCNIRAHRREGTSLQLFEGEQQLGSTAWHNGQRLAVSRRLSPPPASPTNQIPRTHETSHLLFPHVVGYHSFYRAHACVSIPDSRSLRHDTRGNGQPHFLPRPDKLCRNNSAGHITRTGHPVHRSSLGKRTHYARKLALEPSTVKVRRNS